jgi:hypothetical protein
VFSDSSECIKALGVLLDKPRFAPPFSGILHETLICNKQAARKTQTSGSRNPTAHLYSTPQPHVRVRRHVKLTRVGGGGYYSSYLAGGGGPVNGHSTRMGRPQLMVLSEQTPALTLYDVLQDCECLREDRAQVSSVVVKVEVEKANWADFGGWMQDYLAQILSGLNTIHAGDLMHCGTSLSPSRSFTLVY